ncbi:MAG: response regulator transcription factor [Chitinophagaceae bacterium]|nr:MAG: response regulator transcription factor [Chitinophagaceae bacterium]
MDILIIEDEMLAAERLRILLKQYDPSINIIGCLESVEETVAWLQTKKHPDLFLMDIHLSDGYSFEIFKQASTQKPILFTTAYDNYTMEAFQLFSLDYILKPVSSEALAAALNKYRNIAASFAVPVDYAAMMENVKENFTNKYKHRFLAKVGQRLFFIQANEVSYFYADNKIVSLVDREGNRFVLNMTLEKLEAVLDPRCFFRINRKVIVHAEAIEQVKPVASSKLKLLLRGIQTQEDITISREKVADFKVWADN